MKNLHRILETKGWMIIQGNGGWYILDIAAERRCSPFHESRGAAMQWIKDNYRVK